jgi:hypothetical protein
MLPLGKHNVGEDSFFPLFGYEYNVKYVMFWKMFFALKMKNIFPYTRFVFCRPSKMFFVHLRFHRTKYQKKYEKP